MHKLSAIKGRELVKFLKKINFNIVRTKGSHVKLKSDDGRATSVAVHTKKRFLKADIFKIGEWFDEKG